jgi:type I restriction enzyme S subunit
MGENIPKGWKFYRFIDIAEIIGGGTPSKNNPDYWNGNIDWLTVADFNTGRKYVRNAEQKITPLGLEKSSTKILKKGQIIISARGTVGAIAVLTKDMAFNQSNYGINARNNITFNDFVYYLLKYKIGVLKQASYGAVFDTITKSTFENLDILLPPLPEQKAIAEVLSSIDDKIDLLHRQNKTLEEMAMTLFRQWFIEPTKDGLPEGWEEVKIGDVLDVVLGGTPSTKVAEYWNGDIPWINSGEINNFRIIKATKYITASGLRNSNTKLMPKGTTVLAITGATLGKVSLLEIDTCANQSVVGIVPNDIFPKEYIYLWIKYKIDEIILNETGGAQPHINQNDVRNTVIIKPIKEYLNERNKKLKNIFSKITNNVFKIRTLEKLRDTLLPKLISGELRVKL